MLPAPAKIADVAIICASIAVVSMVGVRFAHDQSTTTPRKALRPGVIINDTTDLGFWRAPKTLVMVTASTCHFCSDSMPFYQRLIPLARQSGARIVALTGEPTEQNQAYLKNNGIVVDSVSPIQSSAIAVPGTPTLILVGQSGTVFDSWTGKLAPKWEAEVLAAVTRGN
jgi:hypothetical protein